MPEMMAAAFQQSDMELSNVKMTSLPKQPMVQDSRVSALPWALPRASRTTAQAAPKNAPNNGLHMNGSMAGHFAGNQQARDWGLVDQLDSREDAPSGYVGRALGPG